MSLLVESPSPALRFVETKIRSLNHQLEEHGILQKKNQDAWKRKEIEDNVYQAEYTSLDVQIRPVKDQLFILHEEKKTFVDDMEDEMPSHETKDAAYTSVMVSKVMAATSAVKKQRYNQSRFSKDVFTFYGAAQKDTGKKYCHLLGWLDDSSVKAAHLVHKSLGGSDVSYLFGVQDATLSEARNGITLQRKIEHGMDSGFIVFVPERLEDEPNEVRWRCVLCDESQANLTCATVNGDTKWRDLDGKYLEFLGPNRPARRYLYFRYVMTYLYWKKQGNDCKWAESLHFKDCVWASPGRYLRKSMLATLARQASADNFPQTDEEGWAFANATESLQATPEVRNQMASTLEYKFDRAMSLTRDKDDYEDDDDDEEEEEE